MDLLSAQLSACFHTVLYPARRKRHNSATLLRLKKHNFRQIVRELFYTIGKAVLQFKGLSLQILAKTGLSW